MKNSDKTGFSLKAWFSRKKISFVKNSYIVKELVKRNIKVQYRNSAIGVLWTILNPLLNMLVMFIVFSSMFGKDDPYYALYLLCGTITFALMRNATTQSMTSIVNNRGLLTKNKISQYVFPVAHNISAVINFAFSLVALLAVMLFVAIKNYPNGFSIFSPNILLVFLMLPALFMFSYGLSLVLATVYVFFRDIQHFYNVFLTLWTYLTPMFYKPEIFFANAEAGDISAKLISWIIKVNPMFHFVDYFRDIVYFCASSGIGLPGFGDVLVLYAWGLGSFLVGTLIFSLTRPKFIYNI